MKKPNQKSDIQRENNIKIFEDTLSFIEKNKKLRESIDWTSTHTLTFLGQEFCKGPAKNKEASLNNVKVTTHKTFEAALSIHQKHPNYKIAVLNFASATNPGGGVERGSSAQEESLCRCSTLYPCLNTKYLKNNFYIPHKAEGSPLHNNDIIYSPKVLICKTDDGLYKRLNDKDFVAVDIITCAAPNLRQKPSNQFNSYWGDVDAISITDEELYKIHLERARAILNAAQSQGAEVLILGAFGCGAFKNNPRVVAKAYREALKDYTDKFREIEFAIYCKGDTENYDAFKEEFDKKC